jgi:hypothetical protein
MRKRYVRVKGMVKQFLHKLLGIERQKFKMSGIRKEGKGEDLLSFARCVVWTLQVP